VFATTSSIISFGNTPTFSIVLATIQGLMFLTYVGGIVGYALLIKKTFDTFVNDKIGFTYQKNGKYLIAYYGILLLSFSLFIFATSPIVKTFRDGGYGEIFSMWGILPFYLYFLLSKKWGISAVLLAIIGSTHNTSFIMTLIATLTYFTFIVISRQMVLKKFLVFLLISSTFLIPAMIFFYVPTVMALQQGGTGIGTPVALPAVQEQIKTNLFYGGIIGSIILIWFDYKKFGWLSTWPLLYFPLFNSPLFAERFSRELCLPFGLVVGVASAITLYKLLFITLRKHDGTFTTEELLTNKNIPEIKIKTKQLLIVITILLIMAPISYEYFKDYIESFTDPTILNYYSLAFAESNQYFLDNAEVDTKINNQRQKLNVILFGVNPWIKSQNYVKLNILEVLPSQDEQLLSDADKKINKELRLILEKPTALETLKVIKKYDVSYVYVSDLLLYRWYSPSSIFDDSLLDKFKMDLITPYAKLEKQTLGENGEILRIYSINNDVVDDMINEQIGEGFS
jgi:hypothetical protein